VENSDDDWNYLSDQDEDEIEVKKEYVTENK
jgi:hypothetical protein